MPATEPNNLKTLLLLVAVAIVVAVVVTVVQTLILGKSNVAVTGGVVGAMVVVLGFNTRRKRSS